MDMYAGMSSDTIFRFKYVADQLRMTPEELVKMLEDQVNTFQSHLLSDFFEKRGIKKIDE